MNGVWITGDETIEIEGQIVTAAELAEARQELAHQGTGVPRWAELTVDERTTSTIAAGAYLAALRRRLAEPPF